MWFWIKHLSAAVILLALAFVLLFKPEVFQLNTEKTTEATRTAAQNFTNFYEQIRYSLDSSKDKSKEYIIELPDTSDELSQLLSERTGTVPPLEQKWQGKSQQRKFQAGSKIRDTMGAFATGEGIELVWTLPRDYVVKHYFHSEGNYLDALRDIAAAVAPDFEYPVLVFLCPQERAAVLTLKHNAFLDEHCQQLNAEPAPLRPVAN